MLLTGSRRSGRRSRKVAGSSLGSGGYVCPALAAAAARAEHAGGRAVRVPAGVLEGASGICDHAGRTVGAVPRAIAFEI